MFSRKNTAHGIHEVADEASKNLVPWSFLLGQRIEGFLIGCARQISRFTFPLLMFTVAGLLILVLISGNVSYNLKVAVGILFFVGIVWGIITALSSEADDRPPVRQEPETAETCEDD